MWEGTHLLCSGVLSQQAALSCALPLSPSSVQRPSLGLGSVIPANLVQVRELTFPTGPCGDTAAAPVPGTRDQGLGAVVAKAVLPGQRLGARLPV